jgi:hypothetical protein
MAPALDRLLFCLGIRSPWDREDLVQDALLALVEKKAEVRDPASWLRTVARQLGITHLRSESRRQRLLPDAAGLPGPGPIAPPWAHNYSGSKLSRVSRASACANEGSCYGVCSTLEPSPTKRWPPRRALHRERCTRCVLAFAPSSPRAIVEATAARDLDRQNQPSRD